MKERDRSIDLLRGSAIVLMTITHINAVYYTGNNQILHFFTTMGATLCFSIFLFCSTYIVGMKIKKGRSLNIISTLKKSFYIYLVYILLSILIVFSLNKSLNLREFLDILLIVKQPEFADFLISLVLFNLITIFLYKPLGFLQKRKILLVLVAVFVYILGNILYRYNSELSLTTFQQIIVENLWGYSNLHRFPILFYFPIYLLAILLSTLKDKKSLLYISLISISMILLLKVFNISTWYRWPPSILFLTYGIAYISVLLFLYRKFSTFFSSKFFLLLEKVGKYPLHQFILSTVLIFIPFLFISRTDSVFFTVFLNIFILTILFVYPIVMHKT